MAKWRVSVEAEYGLRLLWGIYRSRKLAREAAKYARLNAYPTRIRKVQRRFTDG